MWTPEIERDCLKVVHWVRCDYPGGVIYGGQHIGKTFFAQYVQGVLESMLGPDVIWFSWLTEENLKKTREDCCRDWLRHSGSENYNQTKRLPLQTTLYQHLERSANAVGANRIIIVIDDAQWILADHYALLMIVCNELKEKGKRPFVLQVGQPQLKQTKKNFIAEEKHQLVARFFQVMHEFLPLQLSDLAPFLAELEKSHANGFSTEFLPHLASHGWRFVDVAGPLETAIRTLAVTQNIKDQVLVPMSLLRSILASLVYQLRADRMLKTVSAEMAYSALVECNFAEVMKHYVKPLAGLASEQVATAEPPAAAPPLQASPP